MTNNQEILYSGKIFLLHTQKYDELEEMTIQSITLKEFRTIISKCIELGTELVGVTIRQDEYSLTN